MPTRLAARVTAPRPELPLKPSPMAAAPGRTSGGQVSADARRWVLPSDVHRIAPVVDEVVAMCRDAGFSPRQCRLNVPVAITEALANAMLRGNANIDVRQVTVVVEVTTDRLVVDVADEGEGFDLACAERTPDDEDWLEREDGRGIFLMRQLMDHVENRCLDAGHVLRLVLHRA